VEQVLPSNVAEGRGLFAMNSQFMFWVGGSFESDFGNFFFLRRATVDGGSVQDLLGPTALGGIAVDTQGGKLYLSPQSDCLPGCTSIARTNLDGSGGESLFPAGFPGAIAFYAPDQLVCWSDFGFDETFTDAILCAQVGDSVGQSVFDMDPTGLAIDPVGQKLYWVGDGVIRRANLDGSDVELLVSGLDQPRDIVLDPAGGRMWWTEPFLGKIQRANLDGTEVQDVVSGLTAPTGIGYNAATDKIYWLSVTPGEGVSTTTTVGGIVLALLLLVASSVLVLSGGRG
jgi:low density lipoprotein receptor-related protein 5/6